MSPPVSAMKISAVVRFTPRMVHSTLIAALNDAEREAASGQPGDRLVQEADVVDCVMILRATAAWWAPKRPSSASMRAGIYGRIVDCANLASTPGPAGQR